MATDTKDWSVFAAQQCDECGFDASAIARDGLAPTIIDTAVRWGEFLRSQPDEQLRRRPAPEVWSPLEYSAHVRDVVRLFTERITQIIEVDAPSFGSWDQEASALAARYNEQEPAVVAEEIRADAERLQRVIGGLGESDWNRVGFRDQREFSVDFLVRYLLHDVVHHWQDVGVTRIYHDLAPDDLDGGDT